VKASSKAKSHLRFGQLELNLSEGKLLKRGLPVRLENLPLQILAVLLEHPGEVVGREELCSRLWPDGTYVDFDEGLNTAIKKLRYALGDSAENPTFIETIPRRGYRFIAPVQNDVQKDEHKDDDASDHLQQVLLPGNGNGSSLRGSVPDLVLGPNSPLLVLTSLRSKWRWTAGLIILGFAVTAACYLFYRLAFPPALRVTRIVKLTTFAQVDPWGALTSDGARLFFLQREVDHWSTREISVAGGESMAFGSLPRNTRILAVSNDQSEILFAPFSLRSNDLPLWSMPLVGGAPRRVADILANAATFSPDGTQIAFGNTNGLFVANRDGSGVRQVADRPECWAVAWSPDGKTLRFNDRAHLWQVSPSGHDLHLFLPDWTAKDGRWTSDGSYFIFSVLEGGSESLWAVRESPHFPWRRPTPIQLTFPPVSYGRPLPSRDGRAIYVEGGMGEPIDTVRFDPASHQFKSILPGINAFEAVFSPDHQWIVYTSENQLWRSRPDGSDRLHLAGSPSIPNIHYPGWSPDSKQIVFQSVGIDNKATIYLVPSAGGTAQRPLQTGPYWPDWTLDGRSISYSVEHEPGGGSPSQEPGIYLFDLGQRRSTLVPGSSGLIQGRWSPDGRFLAAVSEDESMIKLLDLRTRHWSEVARGTLISSPMWSADSMLYFQDILASGEPVYRFQPGGAAPERAYSFEDILQTGVQRCAFGGFAPDGSLLVQVRRGGGDVYALTLRQ
jgi:DNA-binding winged helix-turn-helix (wHTH) protein/Tol biopolymer transport system component